MEQKKVSLPDLMAKKRAGEKITMLTAYDFSMASCVDQAGMDMILVGDSLGMVVLGYDSTVPVTMEEMLHHCRAARRGVRRALLVGDMPFMSYNTCREEAIRQAGRFLKEAGCDAVKLEGGLEVADTVRAIVDAGIPVMGHIGLTPQTVSKLGGFRVQGKDQAAARRAAGFGQGAGNGRGLCGGHGMHPRQAGRLDQQVPGYSHHRDRGRFGMRRPGTGDQ